MAHETDFVKIRQRTSSGRSGRFTIITISEPESGFMQNCTNWGSILLLGVKRKLKFTRVKC
jgi:hypothetical protein